MTDKRGWVDGSAEAKLHTPTRVSRAGHTHRQGNADQEPPLDKAIARMTGETPKRTGWQKALEARKDTPVMDERWR